jgi:hypothetical protein
METETAPIDVVLFGSSRLALIDDAAMNARLARLCTASAPRVFNASATAGDPVVSELLLSEWLERRDKPRLIVLEIQPESINHRDSWLENHALRQFNWRDCVAAAPSLVGRGRIMGLVRGRLLPVFLHRHHIRKQGNELLFGSTSSPPAAVARLVEDLEAEPAPPAATEAFVAGTAAAAGAVAKMCRDFAPTGYTAERLEQVLARCRAENIEVVLLMPPLTVGHRAGYEGATNERLGEYLAELCARFDADCIDLRARLDDRYFADSNHVNAAGSRAVARLLVDEIVVPRLLGNSPPLPGYGIERPALTAEQTSPSLSR